MANASSVLVTILTVRAGWNPSLMPAREGVHKLVDFLKKTSSAPRAVLAGAARHGGQRHALVAKFSTLR